MDERAKGGLIREHSLSSGPGWILSKRIHYCSFKSVCFKMTCSTHVADNCNSLDLCITTNLEKINLVPHSHIGL